MTEFTEEQLTDYGIDPSIKELEGFKVGERVHVIQDNEEEGYYEGDEGNILGFGKIDAAHPNDPHYAARLQFGTAFGREYIMVEFDGMYPLEVAAEDIESH